MQSDLGTLELVRRRRGERCNRWAVKERVPALSLRTAVAVLAATGHLLRFKTIHLQEPEFTSC